LHLTVHRQLKRNNMHLTYFLVALCFVLMIPESISMNWWKFGRCAGSDLVTCPGKMLNARYNEMKTANCKNCDKFFHCKGNSDAVYQCGNDAKARRIAKKSES
jgi:hypothetical protein